MAGVLRQIESTGVAVRNVDVTVEPNLVKRHGIRETPTFLVIAGGKEVTRLVGTHTVEELITALRTPVGGPLVATGSQKRNSPADWKPFGDAPSVPSIDAIRETPQTRLAPATHDLAASQSRQRFGRMRQPSFDPPAATDVIPASASEAMPSLDFADAVQRAQAATVRLRVHDGHGYGVGTGTVIDVHGEEALVMTCGHLFRDTDGKGRIEVDVFHGGQVKTVAGQLIDYDADDKDIAVVAIQPGVAMEPVEVIKVGESTRTGQVAFSFGCDRGDDPTRRDTRITGVNKYNQHKGMSNLEIDGAPIDGRSGGGLFDQQGRLIGVCNSADYKGDVGIYTGPGSIHWQLDRVNLGRLARADASPSEPKADANVVELNPPAVTVPQDRLASAALPSREVGSEQEVIVIIRDRRQPADSQVMTIDQPSEDLMQNLLRYAR